MEWIYLRLYFQFICSFINIHILATIFLRGHDGTDDRYQEGILLWRKMKREGRRIGGQQKRLSSLAATPTVGSLFMAAVRNTKRTRALPTHIYIHIYFTLGILHWSFSASLYPIILPHLSFFGIFFVSWGKFQELKSVLGMQFLYHRLRLK